MAQDLARTAIERAAMECAGVHSVFIDGVADLQKDRDVMWQHRNHFLIGAIVSSLPLWIGLAMGNVLGYALIGPRDVPGSEGEPPPALEPSGARQSPFSCT